MAEIDMVSKLIWEQRLYLFLHIVYLYGIFSLTIELVLSNNFYLYFLGIGQQLIPDPASLFIICGGFESVPAKVCPGSNLLHLWMWPYFKFLQI